MVGQTFAQEQNLTQGMDAQDVMERTLSSYVEYWALDENGYVKPASDQAEPSSDDPPLQDQEESLFEDPDFSDMQD